MNQGRAAASRSVRRVLANDDRHASAHPQIFDPRQGAQVSTMIQFISSIEVFMHSPDIAFLTFIVGASTVFGGVLGLASFEEPRTRRQARQ